VAVLLKTYICIVCWTRTILLVAEFFSSLFFTYHSMLRDNLKGTLTRPGSGLYQAEPLVDQSPWTIHRRGWSRRSDSVVNSVVKKNLGCVCRESNPGLLLGRQLS
jgi:hypothetical protein